MVRSTQNRSYRQGLRGLRQGGPNPEVFETTGQPCQIFEWGAGSTTRLTCFDLRGWEELPPEDELCAAKIHQPPFLRKGACEVFPGHMFLLAYIFTRSGESTECVGTCNVSGLSRAGIMVDSSHLRWFPPDFEKSEPVHTKDGAENPASGTSCGNMSQWFARVHFPWHWKTSHGLEALVPSANLWLRQRLLVFPFLAVKWSKYNSLWVWFPVVLVGVLPEILSFWSNGPWVFMAFWNDVRPLCWKNSVAMSTCSRRDRVVVAWQPPTRSARMWCIHWEWLRRLWTMSCKLPKTCAKSPGRIWMHALATLESRSSSTCVTRSTKRTNYFNQRWKPWRPILGSRSRPSLRSGGICSQQRKDICFTTQRSALLCRSLAWFSSLEHQCLFCSSPVQKMSSRD